MSADAGGGRFEKMPTCDTTGVRFLPEGYQGLSLCTGCADCQAMRNKYGLDLQIKFPPKD